MKLKAVQLDLARQMETLDYIRNFIDFISENGYNSLVLYLEGRVRTESFPYPPDEECYTPEQMKEIVSYASQKNIDVIPVVSALGHADKFLQYPELQHLSELRNGVLGRFGGSGHSVFCPSQKETYEFLEKYLTEIAEIFPAPYIHAGCDESWDMCRCELCTAKGTGSAVEAKIFAEHLTKINNIINGKLGRRMMIWDDMFEYYGAELDSIPKEIIMVCWQYQGLVEIPKSHFANKRKEDVFAKYTEKGIDYVFAPAEYISRNIATFTNYALKHKPLGGLVTTWEKSTRFLFSGFLNIAFAGRLWSSEDIQNADNILETTVKDVLKTDNQKLVSAVKKFCSIRPGLINTVKLDTFFRGNPEESEYERELLLCQLLEDIQSNTEGLDKGLPSDIIEDILAVLKFEIAKIKLLPLVTQIYDPAEKDKTELLEKLSLEIKVLEEVAGIRRKQWEKHRPGISPNHASEYVQSVIDELKQIPSDIKNNYQILKVHNFLPDQYSSQNTVLSVKFAGSDEYTEVFNGTLKHVAVRECFFPFSIRIAGDKEPEALKIDTNGYGGHGFTFFEIKGSSGYFTPSKIISSRGRIVDLENVLDNDARWCFMGEKNTQKAYDNPELAAELHSMEIALKKAD